MTADLAAEAAQELLRTALLAKLAVDLQDPVLARRAARKALAQARLLAGLDFPAAVDDATPVPTLDEVLARRYPAVAPAEETT